MQENPHFSINVSEAIEFQYLLPQSVGLSQDAGPLNWSLSGLNIEHVQHGETIFVSLDYGGGGFYRFMRLINYVFTEGCGAVWVIDSTDRDRLVESREEFQRMRDDVLQTDMPILVLANKQDLPVSNILKCALLLFFAWF